MTKVAVLRVITQLMRLKKESIDSVSDYLLSHNQTMTMLQQNSINSKDGIIQACSLQIINMIQKQLLSLKRDATSELKLDVGKIIDVFERNL